jgi:hypothetical protein
MVRVLQYCFAPKLTAYTWALIASYMKGGGAKLGERLSADKGPTNAQSSETIQLLK